MERTIVFSMENGWKEITVKFPAELTGLYLQMITKVQDPIKALKIFNEETKERFYITSRTLTAEEWGERMRQFTGLRRKINRLRIVTTKIDYGSKDKT